jgi:hypothetical protein
MREIILSAAPVFFSQHAQIHQYINANHLHVLSRSECRVQNEKKTSKKPLIDVILISTEKPEPTLWWASTAAFLDPRSGLITHN